MIKILISYLTLTQRMRCSSILYNNLNCISLIFIHSFNTLFSFYVSSHDFTNISHIYNIGISISFSLKIENGYGFLKIYFPIIY